MCCNRLDGQAACQPSFGNGTGAPVLLQPTLGEAPCVTIFTVLIDSRRARGVTRDDECHEVPTARPPVP
jgi:hypothetical protein